MFFKIIEKDFIDSDKVEEEDTEVEEHDNWDFETKCYDEDYDIDDWSVDSCKEVLDGFELTKVFGCFFENIFFINSFCS